MDLTPAKNLLETVQYLVIILGGPWALFEYRRGKKGQQEAYQKEQERRDYEAYDALDDRFTYWLELCLKNSHLDISDVPDATPPELTPQQQKEELILFTILFSIFERAYLMYLAASGPARRAAWSGWKGYIEEYCSRPNFQRAWAISGKFFNTDFESFVNSTIDALHSPPTHLSTAPSTRDPSSAPVSS